jgi:hypothetical protein
MLRAKHTLRVLKRDRRDRGRRKTFERRDRFNVRNDARAPGRIDTRDRKHDRFVAID